MDSILNWLSKAIDWIKEFFLGILDWIIETLVTLLQFVLFTILDGLFTVVELFFKSLDLSAMAFNYAATWSHLPPQLIWLINAVGLPQCFTILGGAYLIRFVMNLIPSWATRV